jgi:hypothetical protein
VLPVVEVVAVVLVVAVVAVVLVVDVVEGLVESSFLLQEITATDKVATAHSARIIFFMSLFRIN